MSDVFECLKGLPRKIKLGAYDWSVILVDENESDEILLGRADFQNNALKLWPVNLPTAGHVVGTFLHETLHIIHDNHGLDKLKGKKADREEELILGFEAGLISLFRDNPKILTWMKKWLR